MKLGIAPSFLPLLALWLASIGMVNGQEPDPPAKRIQAGPFSVAVPARWAGGVIVEKVPAMPVYTPKEWRDYRAREELRKTKPREPSLALKPGYSCRPDHWAIRFPKLGIPGQQLPIGGPGDSETAPQILIHKAVAWAGAYGDGTFDEAAAKKELKALRSMVEHEDPTKTPVFMDAELHYIVEKKKIRFSGGHGFRVLAQWSIEADLLERGSLHYMFLGMSDDDSCQIVATFPVDLPGLPKREDRAHLGFSTKNYLEFEEQSAAYQRAAKKWLVANASVIRPSLADLDEMMSSLVVRKWQ